MTTTETVHVERSEHTDRPFRKIPEPTTITGPRTRAIMRRAGVRLAAIWAVGLALTAAGPSHESVAFGLSLLVPGAGFAYTGQWILFAVSLAAFGVSLIVFFVMSPYWVPPLVVLGLGALSTLGVGPGDHEAVRWVVPILLALAVSTVPLLRVRFLRKMRVEVTRRNALLAERTWRQPSLVPPSPPAQCMSDEDLQSLRRQLDLLLQPVDQWTGFLKYDQYRESAYRYQLNFMAWGLALAQLNYVPAFTGYLTEAQRNATTKMLDPCVWRYWRWEHLLGSLRWDPDPIRTDNIMLPGYFVVQLGAYETVTGDLQFSERGALTFDDGRKRYVYEYESLCQRICDNLRTGPLCMYPCEPNWVYPACNSLAMTGLLFHDRIHGTHYADDMWESFHDALLKDLSRPDDRTVTIKSNRYGVSIPGIEVGVMSDASSGMWFSPIDHELATRRWEVTRTDHLRINGDGLLEILGSGRLDSIDPGNYNLNSKALSWAAIMAAAREMGDEETYSAALLSLEHDHSPEFHDQARHLAGASPMVQSLALMGRVSRRSGWHDLVRRGVHGVGASGPRLEQVAYPDVLVARAVSDGHDLDLNLVPGDGAKRVKLLVAGLRPGGGYAATGAVETSVIASDNGEAIISVDLSARQTVRVVPV